MSCINVTYIRIQDSENDDFLMRRQGELDVDVIFSLCLVIIIFLVLLIIIIMVIFKCYFSREHIALSYKKWCEHRIMKNQLINSTAHDGISYLK